MMIRVAVRSAACLFGLMPALIVALPAYAQRAPAARLVHCGQNTCLRLSGHRPRAGVAIRLAGQDLAVAGRRDWVLTVPLSTARAWERSPGDALTLSYVDPQSKVERAQNVLLPPGALGRPVELASLVVRAR